MKTLTAILMLGGVLWMQAAPADADDGILFGMQVQGFGGGREGPHARGARNVQPPPPPPPPRERARGQLTDEERRQLHRDLDKANRELYRARRQ